LNWNCYGEGRCLEGSVLDCDDLDLAIHIPVSLWTRDSVTPLPKHCTIPLS